MKVGIPETRFSKRLQLTEGRLGLRSSDLVNQTREHIYWRLRSAVGHNPIHEIDLPNGNTLLQIDETRGPSESHYDRVFGSLLEGLEREGKIGIGSDVLETSTGSAGISFAWIANKLGFRPHVFMPSYVPQPRILETQRLAGVENTHLIDDKNEYLKACSDAMVRHLRENRERINAEGRRIWMANHSQDTRVPTLFSPIADEVRDFIPGSSVDYFIGGIGNGSTLLGIGKRFKELFGMTRVIGFEPHRASTYYHKHSERWGKFADPILDDGEKVHTDWSFHDLPGTGSSGNMTMPFIEDVVNEGIMEEVVPVDERFILKNIAYNDELPLEEKLGNSSLVARFIAERMARDVRDKIFFTIAYDRADRYGKPQYI